MPEGPEARKIAESVAKMISGQKLVDVKILSGRYQKSEPTQFSQFVSSLPVKAVGAGVHGKFLYWILDNEYTVWNTLGMSGTWSKEKTKHARISFHFEEGLVLYFTDQRNFGTIKFVSGRYHLVEKLKSLGPDMLVDDVPDEKFINIFRHANNKNVCSVMMDQQRIAGVGNYLKADSLWLARISPFAKIKDLSDNDLVILNQSIKQVIRASFEAGGATIQVYQDAEGNVGNYSSKFLVYNKKSDPEGNVVNRDMTPDGRRTHWAPSIQVKGVKDETI